jgi:hypothetical protein
MMAYAAAQATQHASGQFRRLSENQSACRSGPAEIATAGPPVQCIVTLPFAAAK